MKSFFISAMLFIGASCQNQFCAKIQSPTLSELTDISEVVDFQAMRLSGSRVMLSWHTETSNSKHEFQIMRRSVEVGFFEKVGVVSPTHSNGVVDYAITDINECEDSCFYSIMQVDAKGIKYFSAPKGVTGKGKAR